MRATQRKGARHPDLVDAEVVGLLETGHPSVNHMEQIAMDMTALWRWAFPDVKRDASVLRIGGLVTRMRAGGRLVDIAMGPEGSLRAADSPSDTVRGWGAMAIGAREDLGLAERLRLIEPFADDPHFAVREWAWLSIRPHIVRDPIPAIELLAPWSQSSSSRIRRFTSEVTRPRGVWSAHIVELKQTPELGAPVLEPLCADPARYVQASVGNWLNDASKSAADWTLATCGRWLSLSPCEATQRICTRGLRTLRARS